MKYLTLAIIFFLSCNEKEKGMVQNENQTKIAYYNLIPPPPPPPFPNDIRTSWEMTQKTLIDNSEINNCN
ncbi:MAG: hypothetical protein IIC67_00330 [Thaumarchaeota archaeon]|nr:hypothetical protein [Nitrososphaerota archaeon]